MAYRPYQLYGVLDMRRCFAVALSFILLLLLGCGGGGDDKVGDGQGSSPEDGTPVASTATIRLQNILARRIPAGVTHLRLTGFDARGQVRYGPQTKPKAPLIDFELVSTSVTRIQVEYLQGNRVVGIGLREVILIAGQIAIFIDLEFTDINARLVSLTISPADLTLAKGTKGRLTAEGHYDDGTVLDLSYSVTWTASASTVSVDESGQVEALAVGTTRVEASLGPIRTGVTVTVTAVTLTAGDFLARQEYPGFRGRGSLELGDFNEDGEVDAVMATELGVGFAAGNGEGGFLPAVVIQGDYSLNQLVVGDFNKDGHLDALAGPPESSPQSGELLLGDGSGGFIISAIDMGIGGVTSLAVGDFDGDGWLDFAAVRPSSKRVTVRFGLGTGNFGPIESLDLPEVAFGGGRRVAVGDVDGDGADDLVVQTDNDSHLFRFSGQTTSLRSSLVSGQNLYGPFEIADVNGDGQRDLVCGAPGPGIAVYPGRGDGTFDAPVLSQVDSFSGLSLADIDGDQVLDAISYVSGGSNKYLLLVHRGLGDGTFTPIARINSASGFVCFDVADLDKDGLGDIVTQNSLTGRLAVTLHRRDGELKTTRMSHIEFGARRMAAADFNEDGILDLAYSGNFMLGDGTGLFTHVTNSGYHGSTAQEAVAEDFDADGHSDLLTSNSGTDRMVIRYGAGDGTVTQELSVSVESPSAVGVGDFNKDGRPDLAVDCVNNGLAIVTANGARSYGSPSYINISYASRSPRQIVVADLDRDGNLDLAIANHSVVSVLLGKGDGSFNLPVNYSAGSSWGIAVTDFDQDGDLDIASTGIEEILLFANDGEGTFSNVRRMPVPYSSKSILAGDVDLDGKVDLVTLLSDGATAVINYGNGDGTFLDSVAWGVGDSDGELLLEDFDGDGTLDFANCGLGVNYVAVVLNSQMLR